MKEPQVKWSADQNKIIISNSMPSSMPSNTSLSLESSDSGDSALNKRKYETISDQDRLKLILLIKDFGMSCHKASKVLNIAYNNAKVIFRIYKNEQRIR